MAAAWVARCRAALAFAFALAEAPFRRRRPPPGAGAVAGKGEDDPGEVGAEGSSSTSSFAFSFPSLVVKKVREADPPASLFCRSNFSSSPSILCSKSEQKKMAEPKRQVLSLLWSHKLSVKANRKNPISILQYDINLSTMKAAALHMKSWLATVASAQECNVSSARVALACA